MENTNITVAMSVKDAQALLLGRKLLTFASKKDYHKILQEAIRSVSTNPNKNNLPSLLEDLYQFSDLLQDDSI